MRIDEWVVREVIDTLHQANITLLGCTGLDSSLEFARKSKENESATTRRINNAILLLNSVKEEESNEGQALLYAVERTAERTKKEVVQKAVEWLGDNMFYSINNGIQIDAVCISHFIGRFRQAMEE